jgi:hypothetical protein
MQRWIIVIVLVGCLAGVVSGDEFDPAQPCVVDLDPISMALIRDLNRIKERQRVQDLNTQALELDVAIRYLAEEDTRGELKLDEFKAEFVTNGVLGLLARCAATKFAIAPKLCDLLAEKAGSKRTDPILWIMGQISEIRGMQDRMWDVCMSRSCY